MRLLALLALVVLLAGCAASDTRTTVTKTETLTLLTSSERESQASPSITFSKQSDPSREGGKLTVVAVQGADEPIPWSDIRVRQSDGASGCTVPTGAVDAGDVITCRTDGPHNVRYVPMDTLLYVVEFGS